MRRNNNNSQFVSVRQGGDVQNAKRAVGTSMHLRQSRERQRNLESYARGLISDSNVRVYVDEDADTASIQNYGQDDDRTAKITIPTFDGDVDIENPYPNIDDEKFYAILQYAEVIHETGHWLHTDWPTFQEEFDRLQDKLSNYPPRFQAMMMQLAKDLWNGIEDGAIEEAIRNENGNNLAQRLAIKNEAFIAHAVRNQYDKETKQNVTFDMALHIAALDLAKFDTGRLRRLLDEDDESWQFKSDHDKEVFFDVYEDLRKAVQMGFTTPNPKQRTKNIFDFIGTVIDRIIEGINNNDETDTTLEASPDEREKLNQHQTDDTENDSGEAQSQQSNGLDKNDEDVAQQHANISKQSVTITKKVEQNPNQHPQQNQQNQDAGNNGQQQNSQQGQQGQQSQQNQQGQQGQQGQESGQQGSDGMRSNPLSQDNSPQQGEAQPGNEQETDEEIEMEIICPDCEGTDTHTIEQTVAGMIAARTSLPFDINAEWVDSVEFVSNDEVCGFRVQTNGAVPEGPIENQGYKVVDVGSDVEILEPRSRYDDEETVIGYECESCSHTWVPKIGGE